MQARRQEMRPVKMQVLVNPIESLKDPQRTSSNTGHPFKPPTAYNRLITAKIVTVWDRSHVYFYGLKG
jgi:hypothetical protein